MQTLGKLRPVNARCAMTIRAAMGGEGLGAGLYAGRIVDGSGGLIVRVAINRRCTNFNQSPVDNCRVFDSTSDIIKTAEEEYRCADAENYCKRADRRQDAHSRLHD